MADASNTTARERAAASRAAQGLSEIGEDPVALDRTAALLDIAERSNDEAQAAS